MTNITQPGSQKSDKGRSDFIGEGMFNLHNGTQATPIKKLHDCGLVIKLLAQHGNILHIQCPAPLLSVGMIGANLAIWYISG